ncbi:aspartate/glutamate racemase family protein [Variovorax sp. KBS0712]|nr:aspartate/glutamate racemase family protein [Variovorax sp. KBS0712]
MGPLAGAAFALRVVQLTPAQRDQEHIPVMLYNDPSVPDRSSAYMAGGPSPLPAMLRGIGTLIAAGADCIATPCNTAHLWFDDMQAASSKPMLHIVDAVIEDLQRRGVRGGPIGILGTPATIALGLYQKGLRRAGFDVVEPIEEEVAQFCVPAIAAVKANRPEDGFAPCADGIRRLAARGAQAVVLGCTELPLAMPTARRAEFDVLLSDSIDALALQAIRHVRREQALAA